MLNRTIAPTFGNGDKIIVPAPILTVLDSDVPFLSVNGGTQDIIRLELIFSAGQIYSHPPLIASATNELMDEGTKNYSSAEIAEKLDQFGAFFETECGPDWATVTLYSLSKFLEKTLPLLTEICTSPAYPDEEVKTFSVQGKQRLLVSLEKVDYLARRSFVAALFGENTAYGYLPKTADYDQLTPSQLHSFFESNYINGLFGVILSGKFSKQQELLIRSSIKDCGFKKAEKSLVVTDFPVDGKKVHHQKEGAIQSAIRIGRKLFNRTHPDFFRFSVLNTVLGGYFGSRLMSNIREDKGYTYGIGSGLLSQKDTGYFFISTEVGSDVCQAAVKEVYYELNRLREDLIPQEELDLVRSYLRGSFQRSIDGPLALADRHKSLLISGLGHDYYERYLNTLNAVSSEELRDCANLYLKDIDLTEVVVGP